MLYPAYSSNNSESYSVRLPLISDHLSPNVVLQVFASGNVHRAVTHVLKFRVRSGELFKSQQKKSRCKITRLFYWEP